MAIYYIVRYIGNCLHYKYYHISTYKYCSFQRERKIQYLIFNANITRSELFSLPLRTSFNIQQISLEFTVAQNISEWSAIFSADIIPDSKTPTHVFKLDANICDCLSLTCRNKFMAPLLKEIMRTSNFPKKCPLLEVT